MAIYTVEIDGKQYDVEGDREPTEQEARQAVGEFSQPSQEEIPTEIRSKKGKPKEVDLRRQQEASLAQNIAQQTGMSPLDVLKKSLTKNPEYTGIQREPTTGEFYGGLATAVGVPASIATAGIPATIGGFAGGFGASKLVEMLKPYERLTPENAPQIMKDFAKASDVGASLLAGLLGGLGGGSLGNALKGAVSKQASNIAKDWHRFKFPTRTAPGTVLKMKVKDTATAELERLTEERGIQLQKTQEEIIKQKAQYKEALEVNDTYYKQIMRETEISVDANIAKLKAELAQEADTGSLRVQKELPKIFRENSKGYGRVLDDISDNMVVSGEKITRGEVSSIIDNIIAESDEAMIVKGKPREMIDLLKEKYSPKRIPGRLKTADDQIPFKQLVEDLKSVKRSISSGAQKGATRFTEEDVAAAILDKNLGEYIKIRVPKFAGLQKKFSPVIDMMKKANIVFKPYKGKYEITTGANVLEKSALGELEPTSASEMLLNDLEAGTEFSPGLSKQIRESVSSKALKFKEAKASVRDTMESVKAMKEGKAKVIDQELNSSLETLAKKEQFIKSDFAQKEMMINKTLENRLRGIGMREEKIKNLRADEAKWRNLKWTLGLSVGVATGATGAISGAKRLIGAISP